MKINPAAFVKGAQDWFRIEARAEAEQSSADVYIYEQIGENFWGEGVSAKNLASQIDALDVDTIHLFVNSPGGAAWDGVTIMNSLRRHKARIEVTVDGLAASAASVIAMAGDHITMNRGAQLMIHDAWGFAIGNAQDMADTGAVLAKLSDSLADVYAARAGKDRAHWRAQMQAETWYTAEEAVAAGLADEWVDAPVTTADAADAPAARFDLSTFGFAFAGRANAPAPHIEAPELPSSSEPGDPNQKEKLTMSDTIKAGLRERLGVTDAEASDETLLAALDETLAEQSTSTTPPAGTVLMDAAAHTQLQADASAGREALNALNAQRRDGIVASALAEGRIAPASKDKWRAALDRDEKGTKELLGTFAANTVPVTELGHSNVDAVNSAEDEEYFAMFPDERPTEKGA